ncbi:hypothetical protein HID58_063184, partial [Brassica napus]
KKIENLVEPPMLRSSLASSRRVFAPRYSSSSHKALTFLGFSDVKHPPSPPTRSALVGQDDAVTAGQNSFSDDNSSSKVLTLPTILTICRVAAVPLLVAMLTFVLLLLLLAFYVDGWWLVGSNCHHKHLRCSSLAILTIKLGSAFGAFLDPVADKITMSAVREWAASQNGKLLEAVAVNNLGKWKTTTQMTALTILLASRDSSVGWLVASGAGLVYVSAGLSVVIYLSIGFVLLLNLHLHIRIVGECLSHSLYKEHKI